MRELRTRVAQLDGLSVVRPARRPLVPSADIAAKYHELGTLRRNHSGKDADFGSWVEWSGPCRAPIRWGTPYREGAAQ